MSLNLRELKETKISELVLMAQDLGVEEARGMRKHELIFAILHAQTEQNGHVYGEGVLQTLPDGFGFFARAGLQLLPRLRRYLRFSFTDSPIWFANRGHGQRADSSPEGRRALFCTPESGVGELRGARGFPDKDVVRQPHTTLPE